MTATHPFTEIESRLRSPPADGIMFTHVVAGSPLAEAGVVVVVAGARGGGALLVGGQPQVLVLVRELTVPPHA